MLGTAIFGLILIRTAQACCLLFLMTLLGKRLILNYEELRLKVLFPSLLTLGFIIVLLRFVEFRGVDLVEDKDNYCTMCHLTWWIPFSFFCFIDVISCNDLVNCCSLVFLLTFLIAGLSSTLIMLLMFLCILSIGKTDILTVLEIPSGLPSIFNILVILGYLLNPCHSLLQNLLSLTKV